MKRPITHLAAGTLPLTHEGLDAWSRPRAVVYLRDLLVDCGILAAADKQLRDFRAWLDRRLEALAGHPPCPPAPGRPRVPDLGVVIRNLMGTGGRDSKIRRLVMASRERERLRLTQKYALTSPLMQEYVLAYGRRRAPG